MLAMLAIVAGCGPAKKVMETQKDSVAVVIRDSTIFRDSIIYVKVEAEKDSVVLPDTDTSRLATRYAESEAYVSNGQLHHSLRNKSEAFIKLFQKVYGLQGRAIQHKINIFMGRGLISRLF